MTIFLSSGHNTEGKKIDSGAVSNNLTEAQINLEFRNLVLNHLKQSNHKIIQDKDSESLSEYLNRIQTGNGSVIIEFHCDASSNPTATGTTSIIANNYTPLSKKFASELVNKTAEILQIKNRGVKTENLTNRKKISLVRKAGTAVLLELFFITNTNDIAQYQSNKKILAQELSKIIIKYENLI